MEMLSSRDLFSAVGILAAVLVANVSDTLAAPTLETYQTYGTENIYQDDGADQELQDQDPSRAKFIPPKVPSGPGATSIDTYTRGFENPKYWTATVDLSIGCTGTLIGPHVLLTAAHCVAKRSRFFLGAGDHDIPVDCEAHPAYHPAGFRRVFDYALCRLGESYPTTRMLWFEKDDIDPAKFNGATAIPRKDNLPIRFERLSINSFDSKRHIGARDGNYLLMSGFGCSKFGDMTRDRKLRAGLGFMTFVHAQRITVGSQFRSDSGVLCAGDSGGAAYRRIDKNLNDLAGRRIIVGVNSASILSARTSFVARTSAPAFVAFLRSWRRKNAPVKICGIDKEIEDICHK